MKVISTQQETMNAKDINIAGVIFHIEENGYQVLNNFIQEIQKDLEEKLAEMFLSLLCDSKQILNQDDVTLAISSIHNSETNYNELNCSRKRTVPGAYILELAYKQMGVSKAFIL